MNLAATALVIIDLQNEYRQGAAWPVKGYDAVLANAAALLEGARRAGIPVFHVQAWVEEEDRKAYARLAECLPEQLRSAVAGSGGVDICAEVAPLPDETVLRKKWPSAFQGTTFRDDLARRGIENLVVTGVYTDSCVQGSVYDAVYAGFRVWLVKDACGSMTEMMHRTSILDMANRLYGGGVLTTVEAVKALQADAYRAWRCSRPIEFPYEADTVDRFYEAL